MKKPPRKQSAKKSITLRDVVSHIQAVDHRLQALDRRLTKDMAMGFQQVNTRIHTLEKRVDVLGKDLTDRVDALGEDLKATILDSIKIRKYVGMAVEEE